MRWKLFATLSETVGKREVSVDVGSGDTLGDALEALFNSHPELREEVLDGEGELYDHIRLLHNGEDPFTNDGFDTAIADDDELALFPPVSGG
ncbi:ubiquitin-like small modifier protein 1 [Halocatena pleomorpha]|uniref:MoaD/ThiS family protein n=1 Tax=Halocatena pleomorpha TaxID=1785090 RepID=A0A3P3RAS3_9EURY|nr:ubiquitin-like small modifier protein 1 [Halocatena pleomorpha]RRJ30581.1 MoaD/ThiS family protein [Halocatena pleomorpha]